MARYWGAFPIGRPHRAQARLGLGFAPALAGSNPAAGLVSFGTGRRIDRRRHPRAVRSTVPRKLPACRGCVRDQYRYIEIIAARMLSRKGVAAIWQLHLHAAAAFRRGNWLSATALVGIADAAGDAAMGIKSSEQTSDDVI